MEEEGTDWAEWGREGVTRTKVGNEMLGKWGGKKIRRKDNVKEVERRHIVASRGGWKCKKRRMMREILDWQSHALPPHKNTQTDSRKHLQYAHTQYKEFYISSPFSIAVNFCATDCTECMYLTVLHDCILFVYICVYIVCLYVDILCALKKYWFPISSINLHACLVYYPVFLSCCLVLSCAIISCNMLGLRYFSSKIREFKCLSRYMFSAQ